MSALTPHRRRFLSICTTSVLAFMTGLILTPAVAFVIGPLRRRRSGSSAYDDFVDAGAIESIPTGSWTLIPIQITRQDGWAKTQQSRSVWVLRKSATSDEIQALSPICTHLGCPVGWSAATSQFKCPCHGGTFSSNGAVEAGPPPRGLDRLEVDVRDGHLWIRWQDFRISVKEKVPVRV